MAETKRKSLMVRECIWVMNEKDGKTKCLIGPAALVTTGDDVGLMPDPADPTKVIPADEASKAIQPFVIVPYGKYVVITNPSETAKTDYPNGPWKPGENEIPDLSFGIKRVITHGNFPIWPGQSKEEREIHRLSSDDYLIVEVVGEVDKSAPYYSITESCARIVKAVVDQATVAKDVEPLKTGEESGENAEQASVSEGSSSPSIPKTETDMVEEITYKIGQRIVIPGSVTPTYIPPTGIELVSEMRSVETSKDALSQIDVSRLKMDSRQVLAKIDEAISNGKITASCFSAVCQEAGVHETRAYNTERLANRFRDENDMSEHKALKEAINHMDPDDFDKIGTWLVRPADVFVKTEGKKPSDDPYVRKAKVPGPTQFCVLVDPEGIPQSYKGSGRVFPGPYDRFRTEGTSDGLYEAYHIRQDRGILLRVLIDGLSKAEIERQIPSCPKDVFEKNEYSKGDEIFVAGFDTFVVPSKSFEVINPETRKPHIGNDHTDVYIKAIGVDQKSGIYVADVNTGNIPTIKGEAKLLLDPRKSKHVKRKVPAHLWNLMVGHGEPHKMVREVSDMMVETPWALSIPVQNNEAALIIGKDRREVVVGPKVALLNYEEVFEILKLSMDTPKSDVRTLETCFLRISGNRISDEIHLETSDFVTIDLRLNFGVSFVGDSDKERVAWFNYKDPIGLLCSQVRSRLKAASRTVSLQDLYPRISDFVRDVILGKKPDGEGHRAGLLFKENNMLVNEVEVISYEIPDDDIADALRQCNREIVESQITTAKERVKLNAKELLEGIQKSSDALDIISARRKRNVESIQARQQHMVIKLQNSLTSVIKLEEKNFACTLAQVEENLANAKADALRKRSFADDNQDINLIATRRQKLVEFRQSLADIEEAIIEATAAADVSRLKAIQPRLVEALEALGNKELATALAENLPKAGGALGFLLGHKGLDALKAMVPGTMMEAGLNALGITSKQLEAEAHATEKEKTDQE
ncbi:MAG: hypothetical protein WC819_01510 [Parcubacteria group bacterium]|jgi:hypothetical protein